MRLRVSTTLTDERRQVLQRRIRLIVGATIGYNVVEAVVAITAGSIASSTALIGFGLDSVIEVLSAAGIIADAIDAVFEDTSVSEIFDGQNQH